MTIGVIASLLAAALAGLLAREARLRRALEALCARLIKRLKSNARARRHDPGSRPTRFSRPSRP
jgi:hypothetical protein